MDKEFSIDEAKSVLFLTTALVMTVTWAVGATGWTKGINIVTFVGVGSILIGTMLARSILPGIIAHLFSIIIGIGWSFWVTSRLLPASYTWLERWENLAIRLNLWYERAVQGGTSYDNLMFVLQMGVIIWAMGYLTVWLLFRSGKAWPAIIPGGVVLLVNLYYAPKDITFWFIVYVMVSLLLVIRFNLFKQERTWRAEGIFFRPDISFDFLRDGFIFSVLVIGFAWLTPPIIDAKSLEVLDEFQGSWREMQSEWNRLFADLNYRDRRSFDSFGSSLTLGGPRRLTNDPVMDVQVSGTGRYWRAAVYDYFTGQGWFTRDEEKASFGPGDPLSLPVFEARVPVTQTYTFHRDNATVLYAMGTPIRLDRSARATFTALSDEQIAQAASPNWANRGKPWVEEITYIRSNATVDKNESYQVVSAVSQATISQLEGAEDDYPNWVSNRYLQLPETVTKRTRELAREITEPYDNNFAKAQAIERYLRANLEYNEGLATPPAGVDKVDYILFTAKEAYCDYYASSMIVMLRSQGIPARMAVGFASGTFDREINVFHVLNRDAHSWVEVYFPRYGWLNFEPTAAQPAIIRPTSPDSSNFGGSRPDNPGERDNPPGRPDDNIPIDDEAMGGSLPFILNLPLFGLQINLPRSIVSGGAAFIGLMILIALLAGGFWWRQQNQITSGDNITSLYQGMVRFAGWMGLAIRPWQTPYEHAAVLQRSLPTHQREVEIITGQYVFHTFSPASSRADRTGSVQTYDCNLAWNRLRPAMLKATVKGWLPAWLRVRVP